jgi:hypothetical protein
MEKPVTWIRKAPLSLWLFLVLTQIGGIYSSYTQWQKAVANLVDLRERPIFFREGIERMEGFARAEKREIWMHSVLLIVFLACAAIKRNKEST